MTDYIGEVSISKLIEDLKKANVIIDDAIANEDCFADNSDVGESGCLHCQLTQHRDRIHEHYTQLERINRNTIYHVTWFDAYAMKIALENQTNIEKVEFEPLWQSNHDPDVDPPDSMVMRIHYSRYAMDGNGFHVGYENVVFKTICKSKSNLKLAGIPYNISPYVVSINLEDYDIESKDYPPEELPSIDSHPSECAIHSELPIDHDWDADPYPDECNCGVNDNWEGYYPPDNDFIWQELDHIFYLARQYDNGIPEYEFDSDSRTWSLGDLNWEVGDPPTEIWWE